MLELKGERLFFESHGEALEIGNIRTDIEGSYAFFPSALIGFFPAVVLRRVADMLDDMNRPPPRGGSE